MLTSLMSRLRNRLGFNAMPTSLTKLELRTIVTGQIAAALIQRLPEHIPASAIRGVTETAVDMAIAVEEAVHRSINKPTPP